MLEVTGPRPQVRNYTLYGTCNIICDVSRVNIYWNKIKYFTFSLYKPKESTTLFFKFYFCVKFSTGLDVIFLYTWSSRELIAGHLHYYKHWKKLYVNKTWIHVINGIHRVWSSDQQILFLANFMIFFLWNDTCHYWFIFIFT